MPVEAPDHPPENEGPHLYRVRDTEKSESQVKQLLEIIGGCRSQLFHSSQIGETVEKHPVVEAQAAKTFELAHLQLRNIIDDQSRWIMAPSQAERDATSLVDATMKLYDAKTHNVKVLSRPCIYLRPKICKFPDIGWCAWIGGDLPRKNDLHGTGTSPSAAMNAFDEAFTHEQLIAKHQSAVPDTSPTTPATPHAKPRPKKRAKP